MYRERSKILKNWKENVEKVASGAHSLLKNCEVYAFGSAITGRLTAASDIDVLIIAEDLPKKIMKRAKLKVRIERLAKLPACHPIQIHLIEKDELKRSSIYSEVARNEQKERF